MKRGKDYIGVGVGAVILNEQDEVLLLRRKKPPEMGCWSIPGGAVEFGEGAEEAILRELEEELGIRGTILTLLCITNHILPEEKTHWVAPAFLVRIEAGTPKNLELESHAEMGWFPLDCLPENPTITASAAIAALKKYMAARP